LEPDVRRLRGDGLLVGGSLQTLELDGRTRRYHVCDIRKPGVSDPAPLLIVLHGRYGNSSRIQMETGLSALAGRSGFVAVYPEGVKRSWADGRGISGADLLGVQDTVFLDLMLSNLERCIPVDPAAIFLAGHSNGGFMAQRMAVEFPGRFAAVGIVAASLSYFLSGKLTPRAGVPILFIHGTADPVIPFPGKGRGEGKTLPVEASVRRWALCNGCGGEATIDKQGTLSAGMSYQVLRFGPRDASKPAVLYRIDGAGHDWPGSPAPSKSRVFGPFCPDLQASRIVMDFFLRLSGGVYSHPISPQ